ncbi:MAG: FAD-dependent oxidoreductase [Rhodocyclaceae bacterium]|nr:MAG: FAD-dependent oxidoreductase [Rhodocyclaceae bacterium]
MKESIVILGSGLAGISVARELRKLDKEVPLTMVTADDGGFYSKPSLSNALAAGKTAAQLVLTAPAALAAQLNMDIRGHTRVTRLLPTEHAIETDSGRLEYSRLVLALGAQPIRLPIEGSGAGDIVSVNSLPDYAAFRECLAGVKRVAILGGGLIGCEFANDLRLTGIAADVFDLAPQALGRLLPAQAAAFFRAGLEAAGVGFHFNTSIVRVDRFESGFILIDTQGKDFCADLVLSAVGLRPETGLARAAGLKTNRGIVTDTMLATSDPDLFAVGDCAEVQGLVLPFVLPIMQQARALAKTLAGPPTAVSYPAMPVVVKTPACPTVVCPPPAGVAGAWREVVEPKGVRAVFEGTDGPALGFCLVGEAVNEKQALAATMPAWL